MPNWTARNLAGLVHGWSGTWQDRDGWPEVWPGRRKEAGGPDWRVAAQKLEKWRPTLVSGAARIWERPGVGAMRPENWKSAAADDWKKSVFKYHKYCVEDGLSVDTPECRSGVSFLPAPADPPPTPTRRPTGCPVGRRRLPGPPVSTGCSLRSRRPAGLSGVPPRRRRPAASRGHRFRLVAPPVAAASAGCCAGRSFPSASREFLPADADPPPPGATGFDRLLRRSLLPAGHSH